MHLIPFSRTASQFYANYKKSTKLTKDLKADKWVFSDLRRGLIACESAEWEKHYLPIDVKGKTVLDIGAGEGETAYFYLKHGAAKVICIEPDTCAFHRLAINALEHPEIERHLRKFDVGMLYEFKPDLCKIDIEGYEEQLLGYRPPCHTIIEVHGLQLRDKFQQQCWIISYPNNNSAKGYGCLSYAYWCPK